MIKNFENVIYFFIKPQITFVETFPSVQNYIPILDAQFWFSHLFILYQKKCSTKINESTRSYKTSSKDHLQILLKILRKFKQTSIPTKIIRSSLLLFLFYSIIMPCLLSETTISCKIFETNSSFYVK